MTRRLWDQVAVGDSIGSLDFPITVSRLVIAAGANRDFNAIHHNADFARATGAPDMYVNSLFLQGMWERLVRDYIGPSGRIWSLGGFRMRSFNCPGDTVTVTGKVTEKWLDENRAMIRIEMQSDNKGGLTVGPGFVTAELPRL
jgi:acyl dehydratase